MSTLFFAAKFSIPKKCFNFLVNKISNKVLCLTLKNHNYLVDIWGENIEIFHRSNIKIILTSSCHNCFFEFLTVSFGWIGLYWCD